MRVFYAGMIKKNSMLVEIKIKAGDPKLVKVDILEDTGTGHSPTCKYTKQGWQELPKGY